MSIKGVTREIYLMGRDEKYPTNEVLEVNLARLLFRANKLLTLLPEGTWNGHITSGYRPGEYNLKAGGSPTSAHLTCEAIDIADPEGKIDDYLDKNPQTLIDVDLYREDPNKTKGWCHLQTRKTSRRTFLA
jgi:hypothetical protein